MNHNKLNENQKKELKDIFGSKLKIQEKYFKQFLSFLKKKSKLKTVKDLVPEIMYTKLYGHSTKIGYADIRVILRKWDHEIIDKDSDALINVEYHHPKVDETIYTEIWKHLKTSKSLFDGWVLDKSSL